MDKLADGAAAAAPIEDSAGAETTPHVVETKAQTPNKPVDKFQATETLEGLRKKIEHFALERDWEQHHTPRNLVLALAGEMGELCECFQWKGEKSVDEWTPAEREHLGEELSDVAIYLIRLADRCNVDLVSSIHDKMVKNARKYPAHLVNGSSQKYTAYTQSTSGAPSSSVEAAAYEEKQ